MVSTSTFNSNRFSSKSVASNDNPLADLVKTEQSYIDTLKMIDCQIAPIWMKQMTSASPDFSELLIRTHDILQTNKRFCMKLTKIAAGTNQLGEALLQWVNDLETPYSNYCKAHIPNLNQRYDILQNPAIHDKLQSLSATVAYEINLESLFNAPIEQLKYYKTLYNRLLESTDPNQPDHTVLLDANKKLERIMTLAQKNNNSIPHFRPVVSFTPPPLPQIQTNFKPCPELIDFERQVDCSKTVDLLTGAHINYQLRVASPGVQLILRDSFIMISDGPSTQVHFVLTSEVLVMCKEVSLDQFLLMYPAIPLDNVNVKSESIDREIVGEYILRFTIYGKKHIRVHADSKKTRNTWVGVDQDAPSTITLAPQALNRVMQRRRISHVSTPGYNHHDSFISDKTRSARATVDFFTYYSDTAEVSPLTSSEDDEDQEKVKPRDTIMDIYENQMQEPEPEVPPPPPKNQTVKIIPHVPIVARAILQPDSSPKKDKTNVTIEAPMSKMSISTTKSSFSPLMKSSSPLTSSPRNIEVQRAIIPEAMQAVTQNTDDYLYHNNNNNQQQRPPMQYPRGASMNQQNPMKPLPNPMMHQNHPLPSPPPHQHHRPPPNTRHPPQLQQQQQRFNPQANIRPYEGTVSPPHSPGNETKKVLFSNSQCDVFHWSNQSWYAADGQCLVQIRLSHNDRTCVAVQLQNTGQLYLNAWILPSTVIRQPSPTDINISLFLGEKKENYLFHFHQPQDAHFFASVLHKAVSVVDDEPVPVDLVNVPQTLTSVMQCKAKLFIQNETNSWSTFGSVKMSISQQSPSQRMMIQIENEKTKLVSATVKSGNVERITPKRITFLLADEAAKTSIVYMIHLREEEVGNKIYEYLRTRNAENGW